jgi:hypothetical protein
MPVEWERIPDGVPEDFQALDGDEIVGQARKGTSFAEARLWNAERKPRSAGRLPNGVP